VVENVDGSGRGVIMGKLTNSLVAALVATVLLAGCGTARPPETVYAGNILAVSGNSLSVYVYEGYRGVVVVHISEKTAIDAALKSRMKAGNYVSFVTDGTLMKSEPPQANALAVKSVVEGILVRGIVTAASEGQVTVEATAPRIETLVARLTFQVLVECPSALVRKLPVAEDIFGHFVKIRRILKDNIDVTLVDTAIMSMTRDGVALPAGLVVGSSVVEYSVDKMTEMAILRRVETVKW
jgi:hypothetical protein